MTSRLVLGLVALTMTLFFAAFQNCGKEATPPEKADGKFAALPSCRLIDTRTTGGSQQATSFKKGFVKDNAWSMADLKGSCGLPNSNVTAIAVNYTLLNQAGPVSGDNVVGAITFAAYNSPMPRTPAGVTAMWGEANSIMTNYTVVPISDDQKIGIYPNYQLDLIIDIVGYYHY